MIDCQNASFSDSLQEQRLDQARETLGSRVVDRMLCYTLYILGFERSTIAQLLNTPPGTVRSVIRAVLNGGLPAFEDRRSSSSTFLPVKQEIVELSVETVEESMMIKMGEVSIITIPRENLLQQRVVLLSLLNDNLLSTRQVSEALDLSMTHTRELAEKLASGDAAALIDKRGGQTKEYRFDAELKSQLIEQFVVDLVSNGTVSGRSIAEHLEKRCELTLSERSIRDYMEKLGLSRIKKTLPTLLKEAKKNS